MNNPQKSVIGMSRTTGKQIDRSAHIGQSLLDIFTTPIGSRIQLRDYGSYLFDLIDSTMNPAGQLQLTAALVDAANKWEPRAKITHAKITHAKIKVDKNGQTTLEYQIDTTPDEVKTALLSASALRGRPPLASRA